MDDIISLALAAEQNAIARETLEATWAGAVANFLVVGVSLGIALWTGVASYLLRRRQERSGHTIALLGWSAVLDNMRMLRETLETANPNERPDRKWLELSIRNFKVTIESAQFASITDIDFRLTANRIRTLTGAFCDVLTDAEVTAIIPTNQSMVETISAFEEQRKERIAELLSVQERLNLKPPKHLQLPTIPGGAQAVPF